MKSTLIILGIAVIALSSCRKSGCWKCTTTTKASSSSLLPPSGAAARETYCDKTEAEIRQVEIDGTTTKVVTQDGKTYTYTSKTTCK